ncbi:MAG: hypothetical protein DWQ36_12570 [Acidobacteria bacterium]|nr:MAG: hypothetical protein DWQ30_24965 [Acidobacteriota bacterium]REK07372.1 MAG: hypothetical protein DWQ36_12570 [Acidobacteriota bacterium]
MVGEALSLLLAVALGLGWPRRAKRLAHRVLAALGPLVGGRRAGRRLAGIAALLALVGCAATTWWHAGHPIAAIPDEHAYLLAAETFAAGRLTNPPVEHPGLVPLHVLGEPVYQSKYPPAQSLSLTPGALLGAPGISLWLQAALLAGSAGLCFALWLPPRWAAAATALLLLRLAVGSYWNQTYWGGSLAASGGFLAWAGAACFARSTASWRASLLVGLGCAVLAASRPYEGLLSLAPLGVWILHGCRGLAAGALLRRLLPMTLIGALTLGGLAIFNHALTGDPLRFPHRVYAERSALAGEFVWQGWGTDGRLHKFEHDLQRADDLGWVPVAADLAARRSAEALYFLLGPFLVAALVLAPAISRPTRSRATTVPPSWVPVSSLLLTFAGHGLVEPYHVHYSAPATAPLWLLAAAALHRLVTRPARSAGWAAALLPGALVGQLAATVLQVPAYRHDPGDVATVRAEITRRLEAQGGRHLVLVAAGHEMPIYNPPLVDSAPVLWAHDVDTGSTRRLLADLGDRRLWLWRGQLGTSLEPLDPRLYDPPP